MRKMEQYKYPSEDIRRALEEAGGNVEAAAAIVGCAPDTVVTRIFREPELRKICTSIIDGYYTFSVEEMSNALREAKGSLSEACAIVGCSRQTLQNYIDRIPEIRLVYLEQTETLKDMAVTRLYQAVDRGEPWAVSMAIRFHDSIFRLYGGSVELLGAGNGNVDVTVLSDEQLVQLYQIAKLFEGHQAGVVEAESD